MATDSTRDEAIARVVESATRMGVELDEREAAEWVAAMETEASGGELVVDVDTRRLRPPGHDAGLPARGSRTVPRDGDDRRLRGSAAAGAHRAVDLRVGRPEQGQRLPGRLRLLRAHPHQGGHARGGLHDPGRPDAREGPGDRDRTDPPAVGGQVRLAPASPARRAAPRSAPVRPCRGRWRRSAPARWKSRSPDGTPARLHLGRTPRSEPGWCKLDWVIADRTPRAAGQRQQRPRSDLGGAGRHDRAARRLPGPVLPGGLPRRRLDPALLQAGQGTVGRFGRRLRRDARARGLEVHGQGPQLSARPPAGCTTSSG